jgi:hypothetical protein
LIRLNNLTSNFQFSIQFNCDALDLNYTSCHRNQFLIFPLPWQVIWRTFNCLITHRVLPLCFWPMLWSVFDSNYFLVRYFFPSSFCYFQKFYFCKIWSCQSGVLPKREINIIIIINNGDEWRIAGEIDSKDIGDGVSHNVMWNFRRVKFKSSLTCFWCGHGQISDSIRNCITYFGTSSPEARSSVFFCFKSSVGIGEREWWKVCQWASLASVVSWGTVV